MEIIGIGSYGAALIASLWLDEGRRQHLECHGHLEWMASETSAASLFTNRPLQKALTSGAAITTDIGRGPFCPSAGAHILVGLGGTGALRLVDAAKDDHLDGCTIHALLPFVFDVYRERALQVAEHLKGWQDASADRELLVIDAADYTQTHESAAVVINRIQGHMLDSVCRRLSWTTGQRRA